MTDFSNALSVSASGLRAQAQRLTHVSENIANADTPGARAKDVMPFEEYLGAARAGAAQRPGDGPKTLRISDSWVQSPDGNNISVEQQTIQATEITQDHGLASRLYRKGHDMLILAAGSR